MTPEMVLLMASLGLGGVFILIAIPLARRKVSPNKWYGFRIPATLSNEVVWYETNAQVGKDMMKLGALLMAGGILFYFVDVHFFGKVMALLILLEVGIMVLLARGWHLANRLIETKEAD